MRTKVKYYIVSGCTVETVISRIDINARYQKPRRKRIAGKSTERKIKANEIAQQRSLARTINCNFGTGDMWTTLKFDDIRLPSSRDEAEKIAEKAVKKLRARFKAKHGYNPKYIYTVSDVDARTGKPTRLHIHILMNRLAYDDLAALWPQDQISYEILDSRADHTALARYIYANGDSRPNKKHWHSSRGMAKPIYTEPEPAAEDEIAPLKDAVTKDYVLNYDDEYGLMSLIAAKWLRPRCALQAVTLCCPKRPSVGRQGKLSDN